ncbi:hypothetical protein Q9L58_006706 [Maublancomyces gigas]|uniref:S1-like domain-containing protein n=1 Tax=Discina gigas TaxID=1032678 RepID=A0ABR3GEP2_9PEZI
MPRAASASRRALSAIDTLTSTPPPAPLPPSQTITRIVGSAGNNLYRVRTPPGDEILVELPPLFRGKVWLRRGGYVLVDVNAFGQRENKIGGEIVNVVRDERRWRRELYWPEEFGKVVEMEDSDDESGEESTVGKMPPRSDDEE